MGKTASSRVTVRVNGEKREISIPMNLSCLLSEWGIDSSSCVLELNRKIVDKEKYDSIYLQEEDSLEIVHFIGGGGR